jgi:hypothetical protein
MMKHAPMFLLAVLALAASAQAQLVANLRCSNSQYVAGEPILATVTITNHAGRDLTFRGDQQAQWLDFVVKKSNGEAVTSISRPVFGTVVIKAGQTMSREVNLASIFQLADPGNYSVAAIVRLPGQTVEGTATNRVLFNLNPGRAYWTQKVGIPGRPGQTREFRVLTFNGGQKAQIYAQVIEGRTGMPVRTFSLGEVMLLRKPMVTIDRSQRMHVLYLATPTMWVHVQIDTDGRLVDRKLHERGSQGDPSLITTPQGAVVVVNSIPYDPAAAAAARQKERKLSDRPAIVYE